MTGPARFAWIIATICCAWTFAALGMFPRAAWAAPRDAIQQMPRLSHTSDFTITQSDNGANRSFRDNYVYTWTADWLPPPISFSNTNSLGLESHYRLTMSDRLDRISHISDDNRVDWYEVFVRLDGQSGLHGTYHMTEEDSQSNEFPSTVPRTLTPRNTKDLSLRWNQPNFPVVALSHVVNSTYSYFGTAQVDASEDARTSWTAEFSSGTGTVAQHYLANIQSVRKRNYAQGFPATSEQKTYMEGNRRLGLGNIGNLQLDYAYTEDATSPLGTNAALGPGNDTTSATDAGLALTGTVSGMPLRYQVKFLANYTGRSGQPGSRRARRYVTLAFDPPVPAGKQASLSLNQMYDEYTDINRDTAQLEQQIRWNYTLNPRTSGVFYYENSSSNDRRLQVNSLEGETLSSELHYNLPGSRGRLDAAYQQILQRRPTEQRRNTSDVVSLTGSFPLGQRADMSMFFSQSYDNASSSPLGLPDGTDVMMSGFRYNLVSDAGVGLTAEWRQFLRGFPGGRETNTQTLNLLFSYQTNATWRYDLSIITKDESTSPSLAQLGYDYATENTVRALVTYSF